MSSQSTTDRATVPGQTRAISPLVGLLTLLALTVVLATVVAIGASTLSVGSPGPSAAFDLAVEGSESSVRIEHVAGETIDVEQLSMTVLVNGTELAAQPPAPFVGASGFDGTPEGPLNARADQQWRSGTAVEFTVADTNSPSLERGDTVTVTLVVDGNRVATLETVAD